ncbi:myelin-associated glycoprotein-like isoform X2 [Mobula birostris]|uniref:myelin-associated glycoprotein-like isoform X2 n=1 Tax=Mobula birostris TaxID=1983395 RepID=UPI003B28C708
MEIPCTFDYQQGDQKLRGVWLKGGADPLKPGVTVISDMGKISNAYKGRAEFTGNLSQKRCSLRMKDVRMFDDGDYCFRVTWETLHMKNRGKWEGCVTISVTYKPRISVPQNLVAGIASYLTCTVDHSCPSAQLNLMWLPGENLRQIIQVSNENLKDAQGSRRISSNFSFTPSFYHDGTRIGCRIIRNTIEEGSGTYFTLDVQYQPVMVSDPICMSFENSVNCTCKVKAKPVATITWRVNGKAFAVHSNYFEVTHRLLDNFLKESSLTMSHQAGSRQLISCVAVNVHGISTGTFQLESPASGSWTRFIVVSTGTGALVIIVILTKIFADRKKRRRITIVNVQKAENFQSSSDYQEHSSDLASALMTFNRKRIETLDRQCPVTSRQVRSTYFLITYV